jgi:hypothetical protein
MWTKDGADVIDSFNSSGSDFDYAPPTLLGDITAIVTGPLGWLTGADRKVDSAAIGEGPLADIPGRIAQGAKDAANAAADALKRIETTTKFVVIGVVVIAGVYLLGPVIRGGSKAVAGRIA